MQLLSDNVINRIFLRNHTIYDLFSFKLWPLHLEIGGLLEFLSENSLSLNILPLTEVSFLQLCHRIVSCN